jgi:hypothetical protein
VGEGGGFVVVAKIVEVASLAAQTDPAASSPSLHAPREDAAGVGRIASVRLRQLMGASIKTSSMRDGGRREGRLAESFEKGSR